MIPKHLEIIKNMNHNVEFIIHSRKAKIKVKEVKNLVQSKVLKDFQESF